MYWNGVDWKEKTATFDSNTGSGSWTIVHKNVQNPLSVSFNKTNFYSDEELVVTIQRENILSAYLWINCGNMTMGYAGDSDKIVLSSGFSHLDFSESKHWNGPATIYISYYNSSGYIHWKTYDQDISVQAAPTLGLSYVETSSRTHSVSLFTKKSGYSKIEWYLYGPNDSGDFGRLLDTTSSSSSTLEREATFSFSLPDDAVAGFYKFTAVITPHGSSSDAPYAYSYFFRVD